MSTGLFVHLSCFFFGAASCVGRSGLSACIQPIRSTPAGILGSTEAGGQILITVKTHRPMETFPLVLIKRVPDLSCYKSSEQIKTRNGLEWNYY